MGSDFPQSESKNGPTVLTSTAEILALRKAMWAHVPDRDHKPIQIYTHGSDQMDLMIHGDVSYNHHYGHQTGADWAAKVKLAMEGGEIKMAYYQIIVDSAAHV